MTFYVFVLNLIWPFDTKFFNIKNILRHYLHNIIKIRWGNISTFVIALKIDGISVNLHKIHFLRSSEIHIFKLDFMQSYGNAINFEY